MNFLILCAALYAGLNILRIFLGLILFDIPIDPVNLIANVGIVIAVPIFLWRTRERT